ncbi:MAG: hypothetical protein GC134_07335 [Proteobacteria bacterium]|nr:hypothetical protein [Pseudomonadota bacterium]
MKALYPAVFLLLAAGAAQAGTLKSGAVVCISSQTLAEYRRHAAASEQLFMDDMLERAQCIIKKRDEEVSEISVDNTKANIQMRDGFKVWVGLSHYVPNGHKETPENLPEGDL